VRPWVASVIAGAVWFVARLAAAIIVVDRPLASRQLVLSAVLFSWVAAYLARSILEAAPSSRSLLVRQILACLVGWTIGRVLVAGFTFPAPDARSIVLAAIGVSPSSSAVLWQLILFSWSVCMPLAMVVLVDTVKSGSKKSARKVVGTHA